ncbi:MAG: hypothetical protein HY673_01425 [Chloroflexi bacterium]|nr:hypothetical protein [Chloroflexota bacterium]
MKKKSILKRLDITEDDLTQLVDENPSLRGIVLGYVAEKKFHNAFLGSLDVTEIRKDDDHDRQRKGDRRIVYKGESFVVELVVQTPHWIRFVFERCRGMSSSWAQLSVMKSMIFDLGNVSTYQPCLRSWWIAFFKIISFSPTAFNGIISVRA